MSKYYLRGDEAYSFSSPARVGPGIWMSFLVLTANAVTAKMRIAACVHIRSVISSMTCPVCRTHSEKRLLEEPPEEHIHSERELFNWCVDFMNSINIRNGKKIYMSSLLWERFTGESGTECEGVCSSPTTVSNKVSIPARSIVNLRPNYRIMG